MNAQPATPHVETAQQPTPPNDRTPQPVTADLDTLTGIPDRPDTHGPGSPSGTPPEHHHIRIPAPFCACGHHLATHPDGGPCAARLPDRCTCRGAREAHRSQEARTLSVAAIAARIERDAA